MKSQDALVFTVVSVATALFGFFIALPRQWSRGLMIVDEFWHGHLAQSVYRGDGYVSNVMYPLQALDVDSFPVPEVLKQSGYSVLGGLLWHVTGEGHRPLIAISLLAFGLFAGLVYLLARRLRWGVATSVCVALAVTLEPNVARFATAAAPETMLFALFAATLLLILDDRPWAAPAAGVVHAFAMVIKGHALIYVPVFAVFLAFRHRRLTPRPAALYVVVLLVTMVAMSLVLPDGSVRLAESGGNYSMAFLSAMDGFPMDELGYKSVERVDAWGHLLSHKLEFAEKVLRMVSRTKGIMEVLGGPALGPFLLPLLCLAVGLLLVDRFRPGTIFAAASGEDETTSERDIYLLFIAMLAMTFAFFWAIYVISRFFIQVLPVMVLLILHVAYRFRGACEALSPTARKQVAVLVVVWFVAYPAFYSAWTSYRDPWAWVGRQLAVRFVDYEQMTDNLRNWVPEGGIVVSEMAHEIAWFTDTPTIMAPRSDGDLRALAGKFDIAAVYQHPLFPRDWSLLEERYELVDESNGRLWIRRDLNR